MKISIALAAGRPFQQYEVDLCVSHFDKVNRMPLAGKFEGFDNLEFGWRALLSAVDNRTTLVNVEGRAYNVDSLDLEGSFKLKAV